MLNIEIKELDKICLFTLTGDLDASTSNTFDDAIEKKPFEKPIVIDMTDLSYISSAGLRSLAILLRKNAVKTVPIYLIKPTKTVLEILRISGFLKLFSVLGSIDDIPH